MVCCNHELLKQLGSLIKMHFLGLSKSVLNSIEIFFFLTVELSMSMD